MRQVRCSTGCGECGARWHRHTCTAEEHGAAAVRPFREPDGESTAGTTSRTPSARAVRRAVFGRLLRAMASAPFCASSPLRTDSTASWRLCRCRFACWCDGSRISCIVSARPCPASRGGMARSCALDQVSSDTSRALSGLGRFLPQMCPPVASQGAHGGVTPSPCGRECRSRHVSCVGSRPASY